MSFLAGDAPIHEGTDLPGLTGSIEELRKVTEAFRPVLEAHYATADDIDMAMKLGCALPMGPFELLDVVGNDVSLAIQKELYLEFREPGFSPAPLLEHLVTAGYLGRKAGRGFRDYSAR